MSPCRSDAKVHRHNEGKCPKCSGDLEYDVAIFQDNHVWYDVSCEKCLFGGREWFKLTYVHTEEV